MLLCRAGVPKGKHDADQVSIQHDSDDGNAVPSGRRVSGSSGLHPAAHIIDRGEAEARDVERVEHPGRAREAGAQCGCVAAQRGPAPLPRCHRASSGRAGKPSRTIALLADAYVRIIDAETGELFRPKPWNRSSARSKAARS